MDFRIYGKEERELALLNGFFMHILLLEICKRKYY